MNPHIAKFLSQYGMILLITGAIIGASVAHKQKSLAKLEKTKKLSINIPIYSSLLASK